MKFLKAVHAKFGKTLIILDGAAQHRAKCVKEELKKLVGLELKFLPPGLPGSERDRGGVAPDETRRAGHPVRHIRQDVQRH